MHVDAPYWVKDNKTVLLYLKPDLYHPNFGGETIFYDHELNAQRIVSPKPGRIVLFDGDLPHRGLAPKVPNILRKSLIYRLEME